MALNSSTSERLDSVASSSDSSGSSAAANSSQLSKRSSRDLPSARSTMLVERRRDARRHRRGRRRVLGEDLVHQLVGGRAAEGPRAGEHVVHHAAEREHVGAEIDLLAAADLLGRHVGGRADARDLRGVRARELRGAEVRHLDVEIRPQHDVGGLDVAVHDADGVGVLERLAALVGDLRGARHRQQVRRLAVRLQRGALHQFHHQVAQVLAVLLLHAGVENADDVRMAQLARERGLVLEELERAARLFRVVRHRIEHLDRDLAAGERRRRQDRPSRSRPCRAASGSRTCRCARA